MANSMLTRITSNRSEHLWIYLLYLVWAWSAQLEAKPVTEQHTNYRVYKGSFTYITYSTYSRERRPDSDTFTQIHNSKLKEGNIHHKCCMKDGMIIAWLGGVTCESWMQMLLHRFTDDLFKGNFPLWPVQTWLTVEAAYVHLMMPVKA